MARLKKELDPAPQVSAIDPHGPHTRRWGEGMRHTHDFYTNTVGRAMGYVTNFYGKVVENEAVSRVTNGILQKGWRVLLFTNRAGLTRHINPAGSKEDFQGENVTGQVNTSSIGNGEYRTPIYLKNQHLYKGLLFRTENFPAYGPTVLVGHDLSELFSESGSGFTKQYTNLVGKTTAWAANLNQVIIYNLTEVTQGMESQPFIALQVRPSEIESKAETSWAAIKSMARNTPMYHYLGAEDSLQLNLNWFMPGKPGDPDFNPYWVINQCRRLKSWSMANGYTAGPPVLRIEWGQADIFKDELWILTSATYHLSNFHDTAVIKRSTYIEKADAYPTEKLVEIIDSGLVPYAATQELIFKRVSSHSLLSSEIYNYQEPQKAE